MKLVFMGTPDFAVPALERIHQSAHQILAVVTAPDKPHGRGQKLSFTPLKELALQLNLPVLQPEKLKSPEFLRALSVINPDIFIVVAFRILPMALLTIPRFGAVNAHASLLPKYRGAAPIHWAIFNGEAETGVTTFQITQTVDTGGILLQEKTSIRPNETTGELYDRLKFIAANLLVHTLDLVESGNHIATSQDDSLATPAPKVFPEMGVLDFKRSGENLINHIRAFTPFPGAWTKLDETLRLKITKAHFSYESCTVPGTIHIYSRKSFSIDCSDGRIFPEEVQLSGRKSMDAAAFLNGFDLSCYEKVIHD